MHLEIPYHDGRDWYDDKVHKYGKGARHQDKGAGVDTFAARYDSSIGSNLIHGRFGPDIGVWSTLREIDDRGSY